MPSRHFYISSIVSALVAVVFIVLVKHELKFRLNDEFQIIPDGFVLPQGCDIKIDMQTGETWARIAINSADKKNLIPIEDEKSASGSGKRSSNSPPAYKNITKKRIQARLSSEVQLKMDEALLDFDSNDNWEFLWEEAPAMEFGLAVLESKNFSFLLSKINVDKSLKLISSCLQNNPLAVERLLEVSDDVASWLRQLDEMSPYQLKLVLRIAENIMNNNSSEMAENFISSIKNLLKEQLEQLGGLDERHEQVRQALLKIKI